MAYNTPYYGPVMSRRQRRQAWMASANDPTMPEGWADFVRGGNSDSFLQDFDATGFVSGAVGLAGNYANMVNQGLGLQAPPPLERSATGEPVYTAGEAYNQAALSKPQGATGGEILSGIGQGAAAGAAFSPVGAAVGAVVGGLVNAIGGRRRKKKQQREKDKALRQISQRQQEFNKASESFSKQQTALDSYYQRLNIDDQLYNLYR